MIQEITVQQLKNKMDENADFQLIDVREQHEYDFVNIGGTLVPLSTISEYADKIDRDKPVIIMCRSGARSANAVNLLQSTHHFENLFNLKGGILAWAKEIDPSKPSY